jgi:Mg-chelatase subunit ChlD
VVKEIFDVFINRTIAYHYSHHIGLLTFNTVSTVTQEITPVIENLRSKVMDITSSGGTRIWEALLEAEKCLSTYSLKYPNAKKRILALSDGEDTGYYYPASSKARQACEKLQVNNLFFLPHGRKLKLLSTYLRSVTPVRKILRQLHMRLVPL